MSTLHSSIRVWQDRYRWRLGALDALVEATTPDQPFSGTLRRSQEPKSLPWGPRPAAKRQVGALVGELCLLIYGNHL